MDFLHSGGGSGPGGSAVTGKPRRDHGAASSDGQALWAYQMFTLHASRDPLVLCLPCPLELVGFLHCCWQLGVGAGREEMGRAQRGKSRNCKDKMRDASLHGGYYPPRALIEKGTWAGRVARSPSLTFLALLLVHHVLWGRACIHFHIRPLLLLWNKVHAKPTPSFHREVDASHFSGVFD